MLPVSRVSVVEALQASQASFLTPPADRPAADITCRLQRWMSVPVRPGMELGSLSTPQAGSKLLPFSHSELRATRHAAVTALLRGSCSTLQQSASGMADVQAAHQILWVYGRPVVGRVYRSEAHFWSLSWRFVRPERCRPCDEAGERARPAAPAPGVTLSLGYG